MISDRKIFLIAIGVGNFAKNEYPSLNYAQNDATAFFHTFKSGYDINHEHCCLLIDDSADYKTVHTAIYSIFTKLSSSEDTIIFYFSGHNTVMYEILAGFLVLYTSKGKYPGINLRELRALIEESVSKNILVIIDSCYSGVIGQERHSISAKGFTINVQNFGFDTPSALTKLIFAASPSSKAVKESEKYQYSFFTYHLLDIFSKHFKSGKILTASTLFDTLSLKLEKLSQPLPVRYGLEHGRTILVNSKKDIQSFKEITLSGSYLPSWLNNQIQELNSIYPLEGDEVKFIGDLNYPDGSILNIGKKIIKKWAIQNTGKVIWENRSLKCVGITRGTGIIQVPPIIPIPETKPGDIVEISVPMTMPVYAATVHQVFKMIDSSGESCFPDKKGLYVTFNVEE